MQQITVDYNINRKPTTRAYKFINKYSVVHNTLQL